MAQFIIPIKDDSLKAEIEQAFLNSFANPDSLSGEDLVLLHVSNYIRSALNGARVQAAVTQAQEAVQKVDSLE